MAGIEAASIYILASLKDEVTGELKRVKGEVDGFGAGVKKNISALGDFGSSLSALVAPLGLIGGIGIQTAAGFDQAMATVGARAGLVGKDLDEVRQFALRMGAQFPVSTIEATNALGELLATGMSATEAMATLPAVLTGSAASGESLADVTSVLTVILSSFGLQATDSTMVIDTLSQAAAVSTGSIASLGEGFANVGAIAAQFGLSVGDTAAALAILDNAGIKGAEGGTALKSLFTQLNSKVGQKELKALGTSLYYTNDQVKEIIKTNKQLAKDGLGQIPVPNVGDVRDLDAVLQDVKVKLDGMTDQQRNKAMELLGGSFGKVALSALLAGDSLEEVQAKMGQQASASEVAETRMKSFNGVIENLKGSVEALMINAFTPFMNNVLTPLGVKVTEIVNGFNEWVQKNPDTVQQVISLGAALLLLGGGAVGVSFLVTKVIALATSFGTLFMAAAPVLLPLALIFGMVYAYLTNLGGFREWIDSIGDGFRNLDPLAKAAVISIGAVGIAFLLLKGSLVAGQLAIWITEIGTALSGAYAAGGIVGVASTIVSGLAGAFSLMLAPLAPLAAGLWAVIAPFLAVAAPIALVAGLIYAYLNNLGGFKDFLDSFVSWLKEGLSGWDKVGDAIGAFVDYVVGKLIEFKDWVLRGILTPFKDVIALAKKMFEVLGDTTNAAGMQGLLDYINGSEGKYNEKNNNLGSLPNSRQTPSTAIPGQATGGKANGLTRVGENDDPEIMQSGGRTYLIPGDKGADIYPRASGIMGGGGGLNIGQVVLPNVKTPEQFLRELENYARSKNRAIGYDIGL